MIQFDLIGSIDLRRGEGEELDQLLRQPKRLALLAYLVTPTPGTWHRRDTLLGVFWPGLDTAHARTALRNALYVLRPALGEGVVLTRGDEEVSIDAALLRTDVDAIRSALGAGRSDEALALYKGELLAGLFVGDSPGFDTWLEAQRTKLRAELTQAARPLIEEADKSGRTSDAIRIAMRVLEINRDETSLRRVMLLLEKHGERAGALAAYEQFAEWLHNEFETEPSAETRAIAERLRQMSGAPPLGQGSSSPLVIAVASVPEKKRTVAFAITAVAVLLVVLLGGFVFRALFPVHADSIGTSKRVTTAEGLQIEPALSSDGNLVAYAEGDPGSLRIMLQRLDVEGSAPWPLTSDSEAFELVPRWSPKGEQIVYLSQNHAWVSVTRGGIPEIVVSGIDADTSVRSVSWSPEGDSILYVFRDFLQVKPLRGVGSRFIGTGSQLHSCMWAPHRKWIACVTGNWVGFTRGPLFGNRGQSGILLFPARGGAAIPFTDGTYQYESPAWSEDGSELWVLSDREGRPGDMYSIPVKSNGHAGRPARIGLGGQWVSLAAHRVAYSDYRRKTNVWSLPLPADPLAPPMSANAATRVTTGEHIIEIVSVSDDGQWLVYDDDQKGSSDIYRVRIDNLAATPQRMTDDSRPEFVGTLTHDGRFLGYHLWGKTKRQLQAKRLSDGKVFRPWIDTLDQGTLRFSPDDSAIAYWSHETERGELFVIPRTSDSTWGPPKWRLKDAQLPFWTPDAKNLLYVTLDGKIMEIPADSGTSTLLYAPKSKKDPLATNVIWRAGMKYMLFIGMTPNGKGGIYTLPLGGGEPHQIITLATVHRTTYGPVFDTDGKSIFFVIDERTANVFWADVVRR